MQQSWKSPLEAHETALQLEKDVYQALLELHASATEQKSVDNLFLPSFMSVCSSDPHLSDYLEGEFLDEQVSRSVLELEC